MKSHCKTWKKYSHAKYAIETCDIMDQQTIRKKSYELAYHNSKCLVWFTYTIERVQ